MLKNFDVAKRDLEQKFSIFLASPTEVAFKEIYEAALDYGPSFARARLSGEIASYTSEKVMSEPICKVCKTTTKVH